MDRIARLLGAAHRAQQIIELGPSYNPVAPKSGGWKTHIVDHATRDELRAKYAPADVDTNLIEDVDTIWQGGALHEAVPEQLLDRVELIIASHVLEHIPDLIGFFQSASRLVRLGGSLSVALPDRRYCFDCLRPWTTTGGLLEAHRHGLDRHSLKTAFDHMAYSATVDGQLGWGPQPVDRPVLLDPFEAAINTVNSFGCQDSGEYQDYHAWQFSPAGFRLVMLELAALGLSDWHVETLYGPENFEFFAVLRRGDGHHLNPANLQARRQELLLAQLSEAREQIDLMLGPAQALPSLRGESYSDLIAKLSDQESRLREMSETIAWMRAILRPVRRAWRTLHGRSSDIHH